MDSDEPLLPISANSPIPIVLITITRYTVTIPRFSRRYVGRKSEQHERKQHEDNRQKYHTILSKSYLYTGKIPEYHRQIHPRHPHLHRLAADTGNRKTSPKKHIEALDRKIERLQEKVIKKHKEYSVLAEELSTLLDERHPERKIERVKQVLYDAYVESERSLDEIIDLIRNADEWI